MDAERGMTVEKDTQEDYADVDITDDFMFSYIMHQPEICIELLEYLFPRHKISRVRYLEADEGTEADTTAEVTDEGIKTYPVTQKTITAAYGQYRYTFRNMCDEIDGLTLGDEAYHVFFNTAGKKGNVSGRLKELLKYMDDTKSYSVESSDNELIRKIDAAVGEAKMDDEWRRKYMMYQVRQRDAKLKGKEEQARETAKNFYKMGLSIEQIAQGIKYPVEVVKQWLGLARA